MLNMANFFWNVRGGCVEINNERAIRAALNRGFVRLSRDEEEHFKPGSYHPGHDKGENVLRPTEPLTVMTEKAIKELHIIEV